MEYKIMDNTIYLRIDKGEYVIDTIKKVCITEGIRAGYFQGIGACNEAKLSTWIPEKEDFIHHHISGMLEMVSLMGNISLDQEGLPFFHSHALFSFLNQEGKMSVAAGHLEDAKISYTGEIILNFAAEGIKRKFCSEAGIDVWNLKNTE